MYEGKSLEALFEERVCHPICTALRILWAEYQKASSEEVEQRAGSQLDFLGRCT